MATYELLTRAIDTVRMHGHARGYLRTRRGVCFIGALLTEAESLGWMPVTPRRLQEIRAAVTACGFSSGGEAAAWSDAPERTRADLIDRFERGRDRVLHSEANAAVVRDEELV